MSNKAAAQARREQAEALRRAQEVADRRRRVVVWVTIGLVLVLVAGGATYALVSGRSSTPAASADPGAGISGLTTYTGLSRNHVTGTVTYAQNPPVGGDHNAVWLNCGLYDKPVPNENAVHSMEHGAVWITYRPDIDPSQVAELAAFASGKDYLVVSPYPGLPAPVVASAWGKQVQLTSASDPRLAQFVDAYRDGPQAPEPHGECTGGTGTPLGG